LSLEEYRFILRADFMSFIQCAFDELNPQTSFICGPHIELIASKLEACRRGEIRRLIINLPPRNLKSQCVSVAFVAWLLGHAPALRVICASYGQDLAGKFARDTRNVMMSPWYEALFSTRISDRQAVHDFETTAMGGRMATSVGGVITGRGADFIILDDPLKPEEALSETQRDGVNEWFDNTLLSRLNDKATGCIVIVMQRLHQNDLVGHVMGRDEWEVLSFPVIAESDTVDKIESPFGARMFRRQKGDVLHPERESLETILKIRLQIGEYNFASQYQQNPTPLGGTIVKREWLRYYEPGAEPARFGFLVQSWDTANKVGELNDYSVCTTWGVNRPDIYLIDVFRKRLNFPDLKRAVIELRHRFRPHTVLVEDKASGTQLIQELKGDCPSVRPYLPPAGTDKLMRLYSQTTYFENGRVFLRRPAPWLDEYIAELTGFPGGRHDDQVDSTTQFLDHLRTRGGPLIITDEILRLAAIPRRRPHMPGPPCFYRVA
jgi:predicted phage terminase large subunit-like protein